MLTVGPRGVGGTKGWMVGLCRCWCQGLSTFEVGCCGGCKGGGSWGGEGIGEDGKDGDKQSRLSSKLVVVRGVGLMVSGDTGGVCGGGGVVGAS